MSVTLLEACSDTGGLSLVGRRAWLADGWIGQGKRMRRTYVPVTIRHVALDASGEYATCAHYLLIEHDDGRLQTVEHVKILARDPNAKPAPLITNPRRKRRKKS